MTQDRTDPHRPSVLDPAEYVFVGAADDHPGASYLEVDHAVLARYGIETGSSDRYSSANVPFYDAREDGRPNYRCHHCGKHGSNIRYFCFFLHKPTKQVIVVGQICARKLNLGSRDEINFQKRADVFRQMQLRNEWVSNHQAEFEFLKAYDERHQSGGYFSEFLGSLWERVQHRGSLTDKQLEVLRQQMVRTQAQQANSADRGKAHVTRINEPPTEAQLTLIRSLCPQLNEAVPNPTNRLEASNLINEYKARLQAQQVQSNTMTDNQRAYINVLMEKKRIDPEGRQKARRMLDTGLTKQQASEWIDRLRKLDNLDSDAQ